MIRCKTKEQKIEINLDIYERSFLHRKNKKSIIYSEEYVYGFLGKYHDYEFFYLSNEECTLYIRKMLKIFDRISNIVILKSPSSFDKYDKVSMVYIIFQQLAKMSSFLKKHKSFRKAAFQKINDIEREIKNDSSYKNLIDMLKLNCLRNKINI